MPLTTLTAPVAQIVKHRTTLLHEEVEQFFLPQLKGIQSVSDYAAILRMFYGFFQQVEEQIQAHIASVDLADIAQRRTASFVLQDLQALGIAEVPAKCTDLPLITNTSQAFGALYVLEGSTLGGRVITKMLSSHPHVSIPADALHFFSGYGEQTGKMWTGFVHVLNEQENAEAISAAACQTFLHLKHWMQECFGHEQTN